MQSISVNKSKKSKIKRLSFLPRFAFYLDIGNYEVVYRQAPITELLVNLFQKGFSLKNFQHILKEQLNEIRIKDLKLNFTKTPKKAKAPAKRSFKRSNTKEARASL